MTRRHQPCPAEADVSLARRERAPFVIAEYDEGSLIEMPLECPWRRDDAPCDVVRHALRHRRTGPLHAVVVCRCHAHGSLFSVYPPGFVTYARRYLDAVGFCDASSSTGPDVAASRTPARAPGHEPLHGLGRAMAFVHGIRLGETVALALHVPLRLAAAVRRRTDPRPGGDGVARGGRRPRPPSPRRARGPVGGSLPVVPFPPAT